MIDCDLWSRAEVERWPAGLVDQLVACGVLRRAEPADGFEHTCERKCWIDGIVTPGRGGRDVVVHRCRHDGCGGRLGFPANVLHQWRFDLHGTAAAVAKAVDAEGGVFDDVADRLVALGTAHIESARHELFLGRGLAWPDASGVLASARRLGSATNPVLLVAGQSPSAGSPPVVVLADGMQWTSSGVRLTIALASRPSRQRGRSLEPKRKPMNPTTAVSIQYAADSWFHMDSRTLQSGMRSGLFAAEQIAPRLWRFDQAEVDRHKRPHAGQRPRTRVDNKAHDPA